MVFVDASALIAVIVGEADAAELADLLEADPVRLCSAVSVWETVAGLCRRYTYSVPPRGPMSAASLRRVRCGSSASASGNSMWQRMPMPNMAKADIRRG